MYSDKHKANATIHRISSIVQNAFAAPWKVRNELDCLSTTPLVLLWLRILKVKYGSSPKFYGSPIVQKYLSSHIEFGARLVLRSTARSNPLGPCHPVIISTRTPLAKIFIGDDFGMTGGCIIAENRITIRDRVVIGANSVIIDTDFHPLNHIIRRTQPGASNSAPIYIDSDVFIGTQVLILKGVTIGARSVIGAGSVVTRDIPPDSVVAGNPATVKSSRNGQHQGGFTI